MRLWIPRWGGHQADVSRDAGQHGGRSHGGRGRRGRMHGPRSREGSVVAGGSDEGAGEARRRDFPTFT